MLGLLSKEFWHDVHQGVRKEMGPHREAFRQTAEQFRLENPQLWGTHFHPKSGGYYKVLMDGTLEKDLTPVVIYQSAKDLRVWVRPAEEFHDGRFVELDENGEHS